ncbi:gle-1-related [Holotrichia oblita]|uniref:Gle-1-related n=1 Tax=Holotrichia oblita TaxID=644536 RepID=A0ACB9TJD6_HOLOL|nr:gle-1-related [Holotrichia oblita]
MDENIKKPIGEVSQKLKMLILEMEDITKKCKTSVSNVEVQKSTDLLAQMVVLKDEVQKIIIDYNKQKEIHLKEQQNKLVKEMQSNLSAATSISKQEPSTPENISIAKIDKFVSKASFRIYSEMQGFLLNHQKTYTDLLADQNLKQFKFDCKKAVNIPVNAISAVNSNHLQDKYIKLSNLLAGKPVPVGESQMSAAKHPQGIAYCMDLLAKKFILQGDLTISSNPEAAFCYGTIILSLWNECPDLGKLLLAHFHKQCPYLVPIHLPKAIGETDEDYYTSLGYQYVDGVVEKQDKFLKRMTGIMRLYSAIIISKPKKSQKGLNPHGLTQGWRWLTATLNLEPKTDITATLIHVFLETAGCTMQNVYKNEFKKIIAFIITVYMPMLKKIDSGGPYTRLEVLLQEYQSKGQFFEPSGILPATYW